jgi:hypothetical protein
MGDSDLLPGSELAPRVQLEAGKEENADHAAGMLLIRGDGFADTEDRPAMTTGGERGRGIAEAGLGGGRLLEKIEDTRPIVQVIAMHEAQQTAFRGAQPMQHGAPLPKFDDAA